jgi:two-component system phosphate regulon sensor histidine kinase PhoR
MKINADPFHMERVFLNLIDNAMKYGGLPPVIKIVVEHYRSGVQVQISDNGKGIPQEEWNAIFEPFHRVSTGDIHNVKGFGLGLSYAQSVMKEHNGSIAVTKSNITGTTFTVILLHK